jgi:hypothetical protein
VTKVISTQFASTVVTSVRRDEALAALRASANKNVSNMDSQSNELFFPWSPTAVS